MDKLLRFLAYLSIIAASFFASDNNLAGVIHLWLIAAVGFSVSILKDKAVSK